MIRRWFVEKLDRLTIVALVFVGLLPFFNLLAMPPFVDEAVHLWWIMRIVEFGDWLRPFEVGKPFEAWLPIPLVKLGIEPLLSARFVHGLAGFSCVLLTYFIAKRVTTHFAAFASALFTAVCPFIVFYQRMALAEIYVCAAGLFVLFCILVFWQTPTYFWAFMLAIGLILAAFAKFPTGFVFIGAMPLAFVLISKSGRARFLSSTSCKVFVAHLPVLVLLCSVLIVAIARVRMGLTPGFGLTLFINQTQTSDRLMAILVNVQQLVRAFEEQVTYPVLALGLVGLSFVLAKGSIHQRWLTLMGVIPIVGMMLASSVWLPRYMVFAIPPMIMGTVCGWQLIVRRAGKFGRVIALGLFVCCLFTTSYQSALIVCDPPSARGMSGYVDGWTSGYGYPEAAVYLQHSAKDPLAVYTFEISTAMQLKSQLPDRWKGRIHQLQIVDGRYLTRKQAESYLLGRAPTWLVTPKRLNEDDAFVQTHLRRTAEFARPSGEDRVTLYEVMP